MAHYMARRYGDAIDWAARAVHRMPTWYMGHFLLVASHMQVGQVAEAKVAVLACLEALPGTVLGDLERIPLTDMQAADALRTCLRDAGMPG